VGHEDVNVVAAVADIIIYEQIFCVLLDELRDSIDDARAGTEYARRSLPMSALIALMVTFIRTS
jgi:hypothetical protein